MKVRLADVDIADFVGKVISVEGVLLGRGNFVDGGTCWVVPSRDQHDDMSQRVEVCPRSFFLKVFESVDLYGGGPYVICYPATVEGVIVLGESGPKIDAVSIEVVTPAKIVTLTAR